MEIPFLIVFDDINTPHAKSIHPILEKENLIHMNAGSISDGLQLLQKMGADCVVLDQISSIEKEIDICKKIRVLSNFKQIPILIYKNHGDGKELERIINAGASDFLFTHSPENLVLLKINHLLKRSRISQDLNELSKLKDEALAILAHDLRSPLNFIESCCKLMNSERPLSADQKDYISRMLRQCKIGQELIENLLDIRRISGKKELRYEELKLDTLFKDCIQAIEPTLKEKNIQLSCKIGAALTISGERSYLQQLINNLLGNAAKFTQIGGKILISASSVQGGMGNHQRAPFIKFSIYNSGSGVPEEKKNSIFDRYEQILSQKIHKGYGLGLAICKEICNLHKGDIWVESNGQNETTFHVTLPITSTTVEESISLRNDNHRKIHT